MKKLFISAFIGLFAMAANAQDDQAQQITKEEAPEAVVETFNEEFADARDVKWQKEGENYAADFELNGEEKEAEFSESGNLEIVKTEINKSELPSAIREKLKNEYQEYDFQSFSKVEKGGKTKFLIEAEKDGKSKELMFDASGNKISKDKKHKDKKM